MAIDKIELSVGGRMRAHLMSFHPARLGLIAQPKSAAPRLPCVIFGVGGEWK